MAWQWFDAKIIKIADESPTTKRFWLETTENIQFKAGQFVTMDLPISEKRLKRWRSYSIANAPDGTNILEFCIVKLSGGLGSTYLFEEATIGTEIKFKGPDGNFCLKEPLEKDLVFICTGTGVAPFRSMLLDIFNQNKPHQNLHLIFGTRNEENILYRKEFENLAAQYPDFQYDIALSRDEKWNGHKGYVHSIYLKKYAEKRENVHFYLCGWSNMIDETVANLITKLGYDKNQIHYELYG